MSRNFLHKTFCTALGLGLMPFAPGTFGALGGLLSGWLIFHYAIDPNIILLALTIVFFFLGVFSSNKLIPLWGDDPSRVVIDEVVGMWIGMLFIPKTCFFILLSFLLFRLFDIYKPLYIRKFEKLKGGWGIMLDDVAAGIYTNIVIQLLFIVGKHYLLFNAW